MPTITPYYGATYDFNAVGSVFESSDGYLFGGNLGVNNLSVRARINLPAQTDAEAVDAVDTINALSGTGIFQLQDPSSFYNSIYLTIDSYSLDYKLNDITDISINFSANHLAKSLRWNSGYLNDSFVSEWSVSSGYQRYDVVKYLNGVTEGGGGIVSGNATEMMFYCIADVSGGTNPLLNTGSWTRFDLPIELEIDTSTQFAARMENQQLRGSYVQKINMGGINPTRQDLVSVGWKALSDRQARCLLHFFENKQGYKRFNVTGQKSQWKPNNVYVCAQWSHTIDFKDSHTINATFTPDLRYGTGYYTGFPYQYTDLHTGMKVQWVAELGE